MSERILPDDLIAIAAFRYALGRMTYIVEHVGDWLIANRSALSPGTRDLIRREVGVAESRGALGMVIDAQVWRRVADAMAPGPNLHHMPSARTQTS